METLNAADLRAKIREIPDFPRPGVNFKDITTLMKDAEAFHQVVEAMAGHYRGSQIDMVVGVESRGFLFGAPLAYALGTGFVLIRKPGKLPAPTVRVEYQLEYGTDALELHRDALKPGQRVLIVDDLLATGGTISAAIDLVRQLQAQVVGVAFLIELAFLHGREKLAGVPVFSLVKYEA